MPDVPKIYWSLRALGRQADADRLRGDWIAARGGAAAAVRRLEETAEELKGALAALGSTREARAIREAALGRGECAPGPACDDLRERTPRLLPAAAPRGPGAVRDRAAPAGTPDAAGSLRSRLAAARERDRIRRRSLKWRRRARMASVAALLLAAGATVTALAVAHRDALAVGWTKAWDRVALTWAGAGGRVAQWAAPSPPAPVAQPLPSAPPPAPAPRVRARGREAAARADAPARERAAPHAQLADATAASGAGAPAQPRILFLDLGAGELRPIQAAAPVLTPPAGRPDAEQPAAP